MVRTLLQNRSTHTNREIPKKTTLSIVQRSIIVKGVDPRLTQGSDTQPRTPFDVTVEPPPPKKNCGLRLTVRNPVVIRI